MAKNKDDKSEISKEQKLDKKLQKKKLKEQAKEERQKIYEELTLTAEGIDSSTNIAKRAKLKKIKKDSEKGSFGRSLKEFPVKMVKEVNKIRWTSGNTLSKKFLYTLIFVFIFAIFFFVVDLGLQKLFEAIFII